MHKRNMDLVRLYRFSLVVFHDVQRVFCIVSIEPVESKAQAYHERVALGRRAAGRRGWAEPCAAGHRRFDRPKSQPSFLLLRASNTMVPDDSSEARTKEFPCKRMEEQSPRLTTG